LIVFSLYVALPFIARLEGGSPQWDFPEEEGKVDTLPSAADPASSAPSAMTFTPAQQSNIQSLPTLPASEYGNFLMKSFISFVFYPFKGVFPLILYLIPHVLVFAFEFIAGLASSGVKRFHYDRVAQMKEDVSYSDSTNFVAVRIFFSRLVILPSLSFLVVLFCRCNCCWSRLYSLSDPVC
jgi:hypothetical protein